MCITCEHQAHHHSESGCQLTTCSCIKFTEKKLIKQDENSENSQKSPTQNIREKLDKWEVDPQAFKKTTNAIVKKEQTVRAEPSRSETWDKIEANWDKIDKLTDDGEYEKVDKELDIILGQKFENIPAWIKKGHNNSNLKKYGEALAYYRTALILDTKDSNNSNKIDYEILYFMGKTYGYNDDNKKSMMFFKDALKIKADYIPALNELGLLYRDLDEYELSIEQFNKILSIEKNNVDAHDNLGYNYEQQKKWDEAIKQYNISKQIEEKDNDDNYADVRLAKCYYYKKDLLHAQLLINKEKITGNEQHHSYQIRGQIYRDLKKFDKAIENFDKQLTSNPDVSSLLYSMAWCYGESGNHVLAIEYYKRNIENLGSNENAAYAIGYELEAMERIEEAKDWYTQQLLEFPQHADMIYRKGMICRTLGKFHESIGCWDKILEITPNDSWSLLKKSNDLAKIGKLEEAIQCLDKVESTDRKEDDPKENSLLNGRGWILINSGKVEEGLKYVEQSLKMDPTNANVIDSKAVGLYRLKKYEEAIKCYE